MIPNDRTPGHGQAGADAGQSADSDQFGSGRDQTSSDRDQTSSDRDQISSDRDQLASDQDQAASDRELDHGLDRTAHDKGRVARDRSTRARRETSRDRFDTADARDVVAHTRDQAALARDRAAEARDREADRRDAERAAVDASSGAERVVSGDPLILRAARDREFAARDRLLAASDRAHAAAERELASVDALTGARARGPGLAELQRQIDRARRGTEPLVLAYIDVDDLKATNDSKGHSAGDALLKRVAGVLQAHLRSYELIVRLGGDEFACVVSGATIESVRRRFDRITAELRHAPDAGSISVGFAQLAPGDSPIDLIERADSDLLAVRGARGRRPKAAAGAAVLRPANQ